MSVFTQLLVLVIFLSMPADGALNKKNKGNFRLLSQVRQRDISPNSPQNTPYPCLTASGSSRPPLSSGFATGSSLFFIPSGTASTGSSYGSSRIVPYPTEGAPYKNSTSTLPEQGNGKGENEQSGSGDQCPFQQTVTLPPRTITLPAKTVIITLAAETITVTPQAQTETFTVTVTPQIQTTTVTVWMTVTANQAPSCPSPGNDANPPTTPEPAPNVQPPNTPIAPLVNNVSPPPIVPPIVTTPNLVVPVSVIDTAPIANATLPVIPNLGPNTTTDQITFPVNNQPSPVAQQSSSFPVLPIVTSTPIKAPYPYLNTTNQSFPFASGSSRGFRPTGSGFAKPSNNKILPVPGQVSNFLTPPWKANGTVFQTTAGPTALASPTMEYFPDDGSSFLVAPGQANAMNVAPMGGPTAPIITPVVNGPSQSLNVMVGSVTNTTTTPRLPILQLNTSTSMNPVSTPMNPPPQHPHPNKKNKTTTTQQQHIPPLHQWHNRQKHVHKRMFFSFLPSFLSSLPPRILQLKPPLTPHQTISSLNSHPYPPTRSSFKA